MFNSSDVAHSIPSNFSNKSCILGIGKGFLLIFLLSSLKSEIKQTIAFILGVIKVGAAHLELILHFYTPMFINLLTIVFRVSSCILGIEKVWHSMAWFLLKAQFYILSLCSYLMYHQTFLHVS